MEKNQKQNTSLIATMCVYVLAASGIIPADLVSRLMQAVASASGLAPTLPNPANQKEETPSQTQYAVGIRGLSEYLHSSPPSIQKLVNEGKLDSAKSKVGRKYLFDKRKVDELLSAGVLGL